MITDRFAEEKKQWKILQLTPEVAAVASRVVWFEEPQKAIAIAPRFVAYAMTYGDHNDVAIIRQQLSDRELCEALDKAPPGIFDPRSWAYWILMLGRYPAPPMPERTVPVPLYAPRPPDRSTRCRAPAISRIRFSSSANSGISSGCLAMTDESESD